MRKFSDFAEEASPLDGDKIKIDDVLNLEVMVTGSRLGPSKYNKNNSGKCLTLQVEKEGARYVVFTGSDVLIDQISKYNGMIPFETTIRKIDRYYTFS